MNLRSANQCANATTNISSASSLAQEDVVHVYRQCEVRATNVLSRHACISQTGSDPDQSVCHCGRAYFDALDIVLICAVHGDTVFQVLVEVAEDGSPNHHPDVEQ
jgi:hypothetical protein